VGSEDVACATSAHLTVSQAHDVRMVWEDDARLRAGADGQLVVRNCAAIRQGHPVVRRVHQRDNAQHDRHTFPPAMCQCRQVQLLQVKRLQCVGQLDVVRHLQRVGGGKAPGRLQAEERDPPPPE